MKKKRRTKRAKMRVARRRALGAKRLRRLDVREGMEDGSVVGEQTGGENLIEEVQTRGKGGQDKRSFSLEVQEKSAIYAYPVSLIGRDLVRSLVIAGVVMVGLMVIYWFGGR